METFASGWSDAGSNLAWLEPAVAQAVSQLGLSRVGVYTNRNNWQNITNNANVMGELPLWYGAYQGERAHTHTPRWGWLAESCSLRALILIVRCRLFFPLSLSLSLSAHYDNTPSFSDWVPFGAWQVPMAKQFADGPTVCGVDMDHNYIPL